MGQGIFIVFLIIFFPTDFLIIASTDLGFWCLTFVAWRNLISWPTRLIWCTFFESQWLRYVYVYLIRVFKRQRCWCWKHRWIVDVGIWNDSLTLRTYNRDEPHALRSLLIYLLLWCGEQKLSVVCQCTSCTQCQNQIFFQWFMPKNTKSKKL